MTGGTIETEATDNGLNEPATGVALIAERVHAVRRLRASRQSCAEEYKARLAAFEAENTALIRNLKDDTAAVSSAETALRAIVVAHFNADPEKNKKPTAGVEVKMKNTMSYDALTALAWAKEKGLCLIPESLDIAAFVRVASVMQLDFVTTKDEPQAQIASDLDKALAA